MSLVADSVSPSTGHEREKPRAEGRRSNGKEDRMLQETRANETNSARAKRKERGRERERASRRSLYSY